jgi:hypothetical protein
MPILCRSPRGLVLSSTRRALPQGPSRSRPSTRSVASQWASHPPTYVAVYHAAPCTDAAPSIGRAGLVHTSSSAARAQPCPPFPPALARPARLTFGPPTASASETHCWDQSLRGTCPSAGRWSSPTRRIRSTSDTFWRSRRPSGGYSTMRSTRCAMASSHLTAMPPRQRTSGDCTACSRATVWQHACTSTLISLRIPSACPRQGRTGCARSSACRRERRQSTWKASPLSRGAVSCRCRE